MAGGGYDLSLAASDSKSLGQSNFAGTYNNFGNVGGSSGGNTLSGGQNDQTTRPTSAAEATNRSPGTTNTVSGTDDGNLTPLQKYLRDTGQSSQANTSVKLGKEASVGLAVLVALLAYAAWKH